MFRHADVVCLCLVSQCCILHDLQFVNAGPGCNMLPLQKWIQCLTCKDWAHTSCVDACGPVLVECVTCVCVWLGAVWVERG